MGVTQYGLSGMALLLVGSSTLPQWLAIGNGSATGIPQVGSLYGESGTSRTLFTSRTISVPNNVTFSFNVGASAMSGLVLREIGLANGSAVGSQNIWYRSGFPGITFDGSIELSCDITIFTF